MKPKAIQNNIRGAFLIDTALVLSVLFSGGVMWQHCIAPLILLSLCFVLNLKKTDAKPLFASLILVAFMALSVFNTLGNVQTAIGEAQIMLCFILALNVGAFCLCNRFHKTLFYTALATALMGVCSYCGLINIEEFVLLDGDSRLLQSFFKYANTTACFLGCGYISFLELSDKSDNPFLKMAGQLVLIAMYLTLSMACVPIFIVVATLLAYKKNNCICTVILQNVSAVVFLIPIVIFAQKGMLWLSALFMLGCVLTGLIHFNLGKKVLNIWSAMLVIFAVAGAVLVAKGVISVDTLRLRFKYMQDGLGCMGINAVTGTGMGSWRILQYSMQSATYKVTFLHNGFLQLAVENGIPFTLLFVALIVYGVYRGLKNNNYSFVAIILLISLHSFVDINFSFGSMLIVLGISVGCTVGKGTSQIANNLATKIVCCLMAGVFAVTCVYSLAEYKMRSSYEQSYVKGDYEISLQKAENLKTICPYDAQLYVNIAALQKKLGADKSDITKTLERAVALSPKDPEIFKKYMAYAVDGSNIIDLCDKYISMAYWQLPTYDYIGELGEDAYRKKLISKDVYNILLEKKKAGYKKLI